MIYLKIYSSIFLLFLVDVFVFYNVIKRLSASRCGEVPNDGKGLVAFRDGWRWFVNTRQPVVRSTSCLL